MTASIPASAIVSVIPGVISAGGNALDLTGLILTQNTRVPIGTVQSFSSAEAVASFFGPSSTEATIASIYFGGFLNSTAKPGAILFFQYPVAPVEAYTRGTSVAALTLAQLQAISGTLSVTIDGTTFTAGSITLTGVGSFSLAAAAIASQLTLTGGATCTYDSVSGGFVITSGSSGTGSTITKPTGTAAAALGFTGGVTSQGAVATNPVTAMDTIIAQTTDWATFMTTFDPDSGSGNTVKQAFAAWAAGGVAHQNYVYVCWDTDQNPKTTVPAASSLGYLLAQSNSPGTCLIASSDYTIAAFICGAIAAINFGQTAGRATLAFRQSSVAVNGMITNQTEADNLLANGYNFYGAYATAAQQFTFFYNGSVSGPFKWLDSYVDQIWLNNSFQLSLMELLLNLSSIPYNAAGYAQLRSACMGPIQNGLNFGAFAPGTVLDPSQIAAVNAAAGTKIDDVLSAQGWYLQILPAPATTRAQRRSPPMNFWYTDAGSVQKIELSSVEVM